MTYQIDTERTSVKNQDNSDPSDGIASVFPYMVTVTSKGKTFISVR